MCPICGKITTLKKIAGIAEFLRIQCDISEKTTNSCFCTACQFIFFEKRLSPSEISKLYSEYRSAKYNKTRLKVEPSYTAYIEMFEDKFSAYWTGRTNELLEITRRIDAMGSKKVLDFGGDGMIPGRILPNAEILVEDPAHGSNISDHQHFDLIYASEVFEHLSDPREALVQLRAKLDSDSKIIIDVPLEYTGSIKQEWDRQSIHSGSLVNMHEHINHFSIEAMQALANICELKVSSIEITPLNFLITVLSL